MKKSPLRYVYNKFKIITYNVGIINKSLDYVMQTGIKKNDIIWMKHQYKDRYFADPFMIKSDEKYYYILCEEYLFWEEKGKITLLIVDKSDFSLVNKKIIIEESTHLSFPFCEYNGNYIMPESVISGEHYIYYIDIETMEIREKRKLLDEGTVDAILYSNENGDWMLFGKKENTSTDLYMYKKINDEYVPISKEPVLSDSSCARSAGAIFEWKGNMYRPVQNCEVRYGQKTKIMKIQQIDELQYCTTEHITLDSFENPPFDETMHTFNVYNDCIIVDGSKDFLRFPMKIFYKKCRFWFERRKLDE